MDFALSTPGWTRGSGVDAGGVQLAGARGDELAARRDLGAHQQVEDAGGLLGVLDPDAAEHAVPGGPRGLGQLVGGHLAQALVALDRLLPADALALELDQLLAQLAVAVAVDVLLLA